MNKGNHISLARLPIVQAGQHCKLPENDTCHPQITRLSTLRLVPPPMAMGRPSRTDNKRRILIRSFVRFQSSLVAGTLMGSRSECFAAPARPGSLVALRRMNRPRKAHAAALSRRSTQLLGSIAQPLHPRQTCPNDVRPSKPRTHSTDRDECLAPVGCHAPLGQNQGRQWSPSRPLAVVRWPPGDHPSARRSLGSSPPSASLGRDSLQDHYRCPNARSQCLRCRSRVSSILFGWPMMWFPTLGSRHHRPLSSPTGHRRCYSHRRRRVGWDRCSG